ncbi:MAG TPA: hypothetical protein VE963_09545 [Reyranella sp.]|nr:hypothetical protein [Reyranella sp.]
MKHLPLIAVACVMALAACEYKRETTVQPAAASTVVTPVPASGTAVVTTPAVPATSTTVYTR